MYNSKSKDISYKINALIHVSPSYSEAIVGVLTIGAFSMRGNFHYKC